MPSDSPDYFMALSDLKAKKALREKFGVLDEWVLPFDVVPCVRIPEFGDACAPIVCEQLKIQSQNDKAKLEEAKHRTYLKGFTDGVMLRGVYEGEPVKIVKPKIRDLMLESGDAIEELDVIKAIHVGIKRTNTPEELRRIYHKD